MGRATALLKIALFVIFAACFSSVTSSLLMSTGEMMFKDAESLVLMFTRIGQLFGLLAAFVVGFKQIGIFEQLGLHLSISRNQVPNLISGLFMALGIQTLLFLVYVASDYPVSLTSEGLLDWFLFGFVYSCVVHLCVSVTEELLFRGYLLDRLTNVAGYPLAVIIQAAVFSLFHIFNPGYSVMAFAGLFLFGVLTAQLKHVSQGLWQPIVFHIFWNVSQGTIYGYVVSGNVEPMRLLQMNLEGQAWITGGNFGPEAGIYCILILLLVVMLTQVRIQLAASLLRKLSSGGKSIHS